MNRSKLSASVAGVMATGLLGCGGTAWADLLSVQQRGAAPIVLAQAQPGAGQTPPETEAKQLPAETSLRLDSSKGVQSEVEAQKAGQAARSTQYGQAGSRWWTVGALYANDFDEANDINLHGAFSQFLADDFEFAVEAAIWYFDQPGTKTGGVSGSMIFRWHFLHADDYDWSLFGDIGIGLLAAFDDVPDGGTSFNFLPRVGGGFTKAIGDSGARLMIGARWHHISNARIFGDDRNPSRDSIAGYVAVTFPF